MAKKRTDRIPLLLFIIVCVVGFALSPAIGPAWDEPDNIHAAGVYIRFFQSGFNRNVLETTDQSVSYFSQKIYSQEPTIARYPPVPLYVGGAIALAREKIIGPPTAEDIIVAFHIATVLFFALLVSTVYRFGRLLGLSVGAGVFAALAAFLFPTLFGHGLSNIKDTAQVSLFTLSLYYLVKGGKKNIIIGGIVWGLALATKFNAIYVPIIWGLYDLRFRIYELRTKGIRSLFLNLKSYFLLLAVGLATAFIVWPYLWFDPIGHARDVIGYFTTVGTGYRIFWDGVTYQVGMGQRLWWYPWAGLVLATPLALLGLACIGVIRRNVLLVIWVVIPMARAVLPNAAFYDGIRHFMEVIPALILLAAFGLDAVGRAGNRIGKVSVVVVGGLVLVQMAVINSTYFPYSTGYYNRIAAEPNVRYDRDIEALTVKEGVDYLHKTYGPVTVWSPLGGHLSWYYLTSGDQYVYTPQSADSIILINKSSHFKPAEFELAIQDLYRKDYTIARGDAEFGWVYRRK